MDYLCTSSTKRFEFEENIILNGRRALPQFDTGGFH
jgi:hypothetical protein